MPLSNEDRESIEAVADILSRKGLAELEFERDGLRIRVARGGAAVAPAATQVQAPPAAAAGDPAEADESALLIESPMVGTFYVASSPDAEPFVSAGDRVRKGQVVCIIEAMKLMNEIESEHEGVLAECLVENAQGVEFGQALFRIGVG